MLDRSNASQSTPAADNASRSTPAADNASQSTSAASNASQSTPAVSNAFQSTSAASNASQSNPTAINFPPSNSATASNHSHPIMLPDLVVTEVFKGHHCRCVDCQPNIKQQLYEEVKADLLKANLLSYLRWKALDKTHCPCTRFKLPALS
jgi:hypothetical protein